MNRRNKKLIFVILLIFIAIFIVNYLLEPSVKTIKAEATVYENKIPFKGIYFTQEYVLLNGDIKKSQMKFKDGDKVPKGVIVYPNTFSSEAGVVCSHIDGYENSFNMKNIGNVSERDIKAIVENNKIKPGIKVINNSEWYIYAVIDKNVHLWKGITYNLCIGNSYYPGKVITSKTDNNNFILFKVKNDLDVLDLHRGINGYIIKSTYNGIVIPDKALISMDGKLGVLINSNGYSEFRRVKVLYKSNDTAVVIPDVKGKKLQNYDEIICSPGRIKDGTKIR